MVRFFFEMWVENRNLWKIFDLVIQLRANISILGPAICGYTKISISILGENVDFIKKIKISIFDRVFDYWRKIGFLTFNY